MNVISFSLKMFYCTVLTVLLVMMEIIKGVCNEMKGSE